MRYVRLLDTAQSVKSLFARETYANFEKNNRETYRDD